MLPREVIVGVIAAAVAALITALLLRRRAPAAPTQQAADRRGQRREEMFRLAFEQAGAAMALVAPDGAWLQFNERLLRFLGYRREELVRTSLRELVHPDDRKFADAQRKRMERGEIDAWTTDCRMMQRNGTFGWVHMNVAQCRRGDAIAWFQYILEPSERGGAARPVVTGSRYDEAIDQLEDIAFFRLDANGVFNAWSRGAEKMFGYKANEITGKPYSILYRDPDIHEGRHDYDMREALRKGKHEVEASLVRKDGFVISTLKSLMRAGDGGFIGVLRPPAHLRRAGAQGRGAQHDDTATRNRITQLTGQIEELERARAGQTTESVKRVAELESELKRQRGIEGSLREVVNEITARSEETFRELKIMTDALKKEIARRKDAEQLVGDLRHELSVARPDWTAELEGTPKPAPSSTPDLALEEAVPWSSVTLDDFAATLQRLATEQFSGTVIARNDRIEVRTYLELGRVIAVISNIPSGERLGESLVATGLVTEEQRDRALEIQQQTEIALGRILLIMGAVPQEALAIIMRDRTEREARRIFAWERFDVATVAGELPAHKLVPVRLTVDELIDAATGADKAEATLHRGAVLTLEPDEAPREVESSPDEPTAAEEVPADEPLTDEPSADLPADVTPENVVEPNVIEENVVPENVVEPNVVEMNVLEQPVDSPAASGAAFDAASSSEQTVAADAVIGTRSKKAKKYHRPSCNALARVAASSRVPFTSIEEAEAAGYERCGVCFRAKKKK